MEEQATPQKEPKKVKIGGKTSTSFKPGQSGNPSGRPKVYTYEELMTLFREKASKYIISKQFHDDIEKMSANKRIDVHLDMLRQGYAEEIAKATTNPDQPQLPAPDMKIQVVFGGQPPKQSETIELKPKDNGTYAE